MKKLLLLFFLFLGFNQVDGALVDLNNSNSGKGVMYNAERANGDIFYFNDVIISGSETSSSFYFNVHNVEHNLLFSFGIESGFACQAASSAYYHEIKKVINLNNGKYLILRGCREASTTKTLGFYLYDIIGNTLTFGGNIGSLSSFSNANIYLSSTQGDSQEDFTFFINLRNNQDNSIIRYNINDNTFVSTTGSLPGGDIFTYSDFVSNLFDWQFAASVLIAKDNENKIFLYGTSGFTGFMTLFGSLTSDLFLYSRLYIYESVISGNQLKFLISLLGENTYLITADLLNGLIEVPSEFEDQFYVSKSAEGEIFINDAIGVAGENIKTNRDYIWLGKTTINDNNVIVFYDTVDSTWYAVDDGGISIQYYENLDEFFPNPDLGGQCSFGDVGCYITQFGNWLLSFLNPVFGLIEKIKEFIMKFGDLFTTEVRDFSFFIPSANAGFADNLNGLDIEEMPSMVQGFNTFGKALGILMVLIAGIVAIIAINHKKNNS